MDQVHKWYIHIHILKNSHLQIILKESNIQYGCFVGSFKLSVLFLLVKRSFFILSDPLRKLQNLIALLFQGSIVHQ